MDGADTGTGLHGNNAFNRHRQIDDDAVTLLDALGLQRVGELGNLGQQLLVGDVGDGAVIGFQDDGNLVAKTGFDIAVKAVVGDVQRTVGKPLEERRRRIVKRLRERLLPGNVLTSQTGPVTVVVFVGFRTQCLVSVHAGNRRLLDEFGRGLDKLYGIILGHIPSPVLYYGSC